jgi:hypothetical protein
MRGHARPAAGQQHLPGEPKRPELGDRRARFGPRLVGQKQPAEQGISGGLDALNATL